MFNISASLLFKAMQFYNDNGFVFLDAPLLVDDDIIEMTLPNDRKSHKHNELNYVGSAEQSFYQLLKNGFKPTNNKYLLITPCQRDEPILDNSHLEIFLKVELIVIDGCHHGLINIVSDFYKSIDIVSFKQLTNDGIDLMVNNVEVGSFGCRNYMGYNIVYGTGLALPRINYAVNK